MATRIGIDQRKTTHVNFCISHLSACHPALLSKIKGSSNKLHSQTTWLESPKGKHREVLSESRQRNERAKKSDLIICEKEVKDVAFQFVN